MVNVHARLDLGYSVNNTFYSPSKSAEEASGEVADFIASSYYRKFFCCLIIGEKLTISTEHLEAYKNERHYTKFN